MTRRSRHTGVLDEGGIVLTLERLLLLVLCLGMCAVTATQAQATSVPACPVGQVPTWNNSGCMATQTQPSVSGYGIPSAGKAYLPGGSVNANPAMQDCNGVPIPIGQPCSAAKPSLATLPVSSIPSTIASQSQSTTSSTPPSPAIHVSPGQPAADPLSGASAGASGAFATTAAPTIDATATLEGLLGDWYTGWLSYVAGAFNFSPATQESISMTFLGFNACLQAQQQACEDAIWQSISQWIGPSLPQTSAGS